VNSRGCGQITVDALWRGLRYHTQAVCATAGAAAFSFGVVFSPSCNRNRDHPIAGLCFGR
jgi:hypothetical protein